MNSRIDPFAPRRRGRRVRSPRPPRVPSSSVNTRRDLIRIDSAPIRKRALNAHQKAEKSLQTLQARLKKYHESDVPGFRAWLHGTFGAILTQCREALTATETKTSILEEIDELSARYGLSEVAAYRKWQWRKAHPEEAEKEDNLFYEKMRKEQEEASRRGDPDPWGPDEEPPFDDDDFENDPDLNDEEIMADFIEMMTGRRPHTKRGRPAAPQPRRPEDNSVKTVYRSIVRLLHPDHHGHMSEARRHLWDEAQDAYRRQDLAALHAILSRCDDSAAGIGKHSPISLILRLTHDLKKAARSIQQEIRQKKRDTAWDYETHITQPKFVTAIRHQLKWDLENAQSRLAAVSIHLAKLERMASAPSQRKPVGRKPKPRGSFHEEDDLFF